MGRLPLDVDRESSEVERLLRQLRQLDDPTPEERQRADASVRSMLAAHGLRNPPSLPAPVSAASASVRSVVAWKLLGASASVVALLAIGFWGASAWRQNERPAPPPPEERLSSVPIPTPAPAPAPAPQLQPLAASSAPRPAPRTHKASAEDSLAEELRFLASVDADIRAGSFDRALHRLSHNHKPYSQLQEERSAMRVLALCGRDHDGAAARARDQFLKTAPSSLLTTRVQAACKDVVP